MLNTLAPVILVIASIWLFFGYTNPTYTGVTGSAVRSERSVAELKSEKQEYERALDTASQIEVVRENLLTKFNSLKPEDKDKILKLLPDHVDSVRLIIDINNIAAQYGMSLTKISISGPEESKPTASGANNTAPANPDQAAIGNKTVGPDTDLFGTIKLGFSVSGPYYSFLQFMDKLQNSLRVVDVNSVAFSSVPGSSPATISDLTGKAVTPDFYEYGVTIQTYYLR